MRILESSEALLARAEQQGIRSMVLDLENTLVRYGAAALSEGAAEFLRQLSLHGYSVLVASNASRSPIFSELDSLGVPFMAGCWKPFSRCLRWWCHAMDVRAEQVLVVGDQVLTDGLLALFGGARFLLTEPVDRTEPAWARVQRFLGRPVARFVSSRVGLDTS